MKIKTFHEFIEEKYGSISEAGEPPKEELPGERKLKEILGDDVTERIKKAMVKDAINGKNVPQQQPIPQNKIKPPKGK